MKKTAEIFFCCDGNKNIGSGHIMRCLALADSAADHEYECCFLTTGNEFEKVIHAHAHGNIVLNTSYDRLDEALNCTVNLVKKHKPIVVFVDSYYVSDFYLRSLHYACASIGAKLVYIDDILAFPYPCDLLLNYNIYACDKEGDYRALYEKSDLEVPQLLLGTNYVPLRKEFQGLPKRIVKKIATKILISTGGADTVHLGLGLIYQIINDKSLKAFHFNFILGAMNQDAEKMIFLAEKIPNISIHQNVTEMSILMRQCDVAISAAGSTLYELCATQTPTITYIMADNQILGAEGFENYGVLKNSGDVRIKGITEVTKELVKNAIELCLNYEERKKISEIQHTITDGQGAWRVIAEFH